MKWLRPYWEHITNNQRHIGGRELVHHVLGMISSAFPNSVNSQTSIDLDFLIVCLNFILLIGLL